MHIAVMDDNIADRKQLERLLDRESDRRIQTTGNLYIDSFGALESLFIAPKQYDFFMVDIADNPDECVNTAWKLRNMGIKVPVCILRNQNEFSDCKDLPDDVLFLEKPIKVAELTETIDKVIALWDEKKDEYKIPDTSDDIPEAKKNIFRRIFEYFY